MFRSEPAALWALLAVIVQAVGLLWVNDWNPAAVDTQLWLVPIVTAIAGLATRQQVMPVDTIKEAGLTPAAIQAKADDKSIPRAKG